MSLSTLAQPLSLDTLQFVTAHLMHWKGRRVSESIWVSLCATSSKDQSIWPVSLTWLTPKKSIIILFQHSWSDLWLERRKTTGKGVLNWRCRWDRRKDQIWRISVFLNKKVILFVWGAFNLQAILVQVTIIKMAVTLGIIILGARSYRRGWVVTFLESSLTLKFLKALTSAGIWQMISIKKAWAAWVALAIKEKGTQAVLRRVFHLVRVELNKLQLQDIHQGKEFAHLHQTKITQMSSKVSAWDGCE